MVITMRMMIVTICITVCDKTAIVTMMVKTILNMMVKTMTIPMIIMTVIINHGHHDKMTMIVTRTMTPLLHDGDTDSGNMLVVIVSF